MYNLYFWNKLYYVSRLTLLEFVLVSLQIGASEASYICRISEEQKDSILDYGVIDFDERFWDYVDNFTGI